MDQARRDEFRTMVLGALSALYNAALRMVRSDQEAEDLVQETYLHAFEHADQLESLAACTRCGCSGSCATASFRNVALRTPGRNWC